MAIVSTGIRARANSESKKQDNHTQDLANLYFSLEHNRKYLNVLLTDTLINSNGNFKPGTSDVITEFLLDKGTHIGQQEIQRLIPESDNNLNKLLVNAVKDFVLISSNRYSDKGFKFIKNLLQSKDEKDNKFAKTILSEILKYNDTSLLFECVQSELLDSKSLKDIILGTSENMISTTVKSLLNSMIHSTDINVNKPGMKVLKSLYRDRNISAISLVISLESSKSDFDKSVAKYITKTSPIHLPEATTESNRTSPNNMFAVFSLNIEEIAAPQ
jgi:hypothetical protein